MKTSRSKGNQLPQVFVEQVHDVVLEAESAVFGRVLWPHPSLSDFPTADQLPPATAESAPIFYPAGRPKFSSTQVLKKGSTNPSFPDGELGKLPNIFKGILRFWGAHRLNVLEL